MSKSASGKADSGNTPSDKEFWCDVCRRSFDTEHAFLQHQRAKHDQNPRRSDPDWLWEQRWVEGRSQRDIADELGISHNGVGYQLRKYGMGGRVHPFIDDPEIFYHLYIIRDMSAEYLADKFNTHRETIHRRAREYDAQKPVHRKNTWGLKWAIPYIREKYKEEKMPATDIADELGVATSGVLEQMYENDIKLRDQSYYSGENCKMYEGGETINYKGGWDKSRREAKERDDHTCQRCGVHDSDTDEYLDVHHKVPYTSFDDPFEANKLDNLVALCRSCHRKVESWPVQPS